MLLPPQQSSILCRGVNLIGDRLRSPLTRRYFAKVASPPALVPFVVYFAGQPTDLYQIEQWFRPLKKLANAQGQVALLVGNPRAAMVTSRATDLPVAFTPTSDSVEAFIEQRQVKAIMYVNNNQANFTTLRINGPAHIHLSHGESEKSSMASNQLKAYDFSFIAGQASHDRIVRQVPRFHEEHLAHIGRPQLDSVLPASFPEAAGRIRVIYAPTWEGDGKDMAYGSLETTGEPLVQTLLADKRIQLVFRPHPKSGTKSPSYGRALSQVERLIRLANSEGPTVHVLDRTGDAVASMKGSDIVISDTSAMAMDAIGLGLPLVLTGPQTGMESAPPWLSGSVPSLASRPEETLPSWLAELAAAGPSPQQLAIRKYVFGSEESANGTERFIAAMESATA